jgi:hypothetical protein
VLIVCACSLAAAAKDPKTTRAKTTDDLHSVLDENGARGLERTDACKVAGRPVSSIAYRSLFENHVSKGRCTCPRSWPANATNAPPPFYPPSFNAAYINRLTSLIVFVQASRVPAAASALAEARELSAMTPCA